MTIRNRNQMPGANLYYQGGSFPLVVIPTASANMIAQSQAVTLNTPLTLNGAGVVNFSSITTQCVLPYPMPIVVTCNAAADTFVIVCDGLDQFGVRRTVSWQKSQTASATQRDAAGRCWTRIYSLYFTAYSSAGNPTIGYVLPVAADTGQNSIMRFPLPFRLATASQLIGVYVEDDGGSTVTTGASGTMIRSGVGTFTVLNEAGTGAYASYWGYVPVATVQPTRAQRYRLIIDPAFVEQYQ